jgi:hypothetical protein
LAWRWAAIMTAIPPVIPPKVSSPGHVNRLPGLGRRPPSMAL